MADGDREHWDDRYAAATQLAEPGLPQHFVGHTKRLAQATSAIEVACGAGRASVWLALQGVQVNAYDISPVAIAQANELARKHGVADRCTFDVADFDDGLPAGPQVDLVFCNMFRDNRLDGPMMQRLKRHGTLAVSALSEVGASSGRFRVKPGELADAFSSLELLDHGEGEGVAWLVARSRS